MKALIGCLTLISVSCTIFSPEAIAQNVRYPKPMWGKNRLDWCLDWGRNCGKEAAQAWCQAMGHEGATHWTQAQDIGGQSPTVVMRTRELCNKRHCDGFTEITCNLVVRGGRSESSGKEDSPSLLYAIVQYPDGRCRIHQTSSNQSPPGTFLATYDSSEHEKAQDELQNLLKNGRCF